MAPLLRLDSVTAGYGATPVLADVSLTVQPGEAWVVLGPNGAGKSTLVRTVMGLVAPRAGRVEVCGLPLPGTSPRTLAKVAAWVPQVVDEESGFTGLEVALMGRAPHLSTWGVPGALDEAKAREVLASVDAASLADKRLSDVSGGERRRVWLARALLQEPKLLVLDEPTAFLDVKHQVDTLRVVRERVAQGLGVLAVLHDVNLARHLATHVLLLKHGRVEASGPVDEVLTVDRLSALYDLALESHGGVFSPPLPRRGSGLG